MLGLWWLWRWRQRWIVRSRVGSCEGDCANYIRASKFLFGVWSNMSGKQGCSLETFLSFNDASYY